MSYHIKIYHIISKYIIIIRLSETYKWQSWNISKLIFSSKFGFVHSTFRNLQLLLLDGNLINIMNWCFHWGKPPIKNAVQMGIIHIVIKHTHAHTSNEGGCGCWTTSRRKLCTGRYKLMLWLLRGAISWKNFPHRLLWPFDNIQGLS